jgi:hypothetical protein
LYHRPRIWSLRDGGQTTEPRTTEPSDADQLPGQAEAAPATLRGEIQKLAENCRYRAECQITASGFWGNFQLLVGGAAAISAGVAGASAFSDQNVIAGAFAVAATVLAAVVATVKAGERAAAHEQYGNELNLLSEAAFRLYELSAVSLADHGTPLDEFEGIVAARDQLARKAPFVNRRLCGKANRFLEKGESYYGYYPKPGSQVGIVRRLIRRVTRRTKGELSAEAQKQPD